MILRRALNPFGIETGQLLRRSEPITGRKLPVDPNTGEIAAPAAADLVSVTTMFDARPVNSTDFEFTAWGYGAIGSGALSVTAQVPAGYVAVVRSVSWDAIYTGTLASPGNQYDIYGLEVRAYAAGGPIGADPVLVTLTNKGVPLDGYGGMLLGFSVDELPCYFIVDQNQNMGVTFQPPLADGGSSFPQAYVRFQGNLLRKTGRWIELEAASTTRPALPAAARPVAIPSAPVAVAVRQPVFRMVSQTSAIRRQPARSFFRLGPWKR